ncbi:tRNA preQ1(34) S-adenosylmethionine ribosyltransferase-isomerase QueA [Isosphaeraceae bacterium EP7]
MLTADFDFDLPGDLIAQQPAEPRDQSRLMVLRRGNRSIEHRIFADLPDLLNPGDVLVRNVSKVVPARLIGRRVATGGAWEGLFLRALADNTWEILATTRGRPQPGEIVEVGQGLQLTLVERHEAGRWIVCPHAEAGLDLEGLLERHGQIPLPPYIRKGLEGPGDRVNYQTVYARDPGSVAAPTAGLHFTPLVFDRLDARDIARVDATLHVGIGTFRPIQTESIEDHALHGEWAELTDSAVQTLLARREAGGRIVAVGTTSARTLETAAKPTGRLAPFRGETSTYLMPGHDFRGLDALLTNFHLPRSSLLVLVSALAGVEFAREAYAEAVRLRYRFYSFGDAMLIL